MRVVRHWNGCCPGIGQDRVNFHQNPGRDTARWADPAPTWPNRARYSIPCAVMLGSGGGGAAAGTHSRLGSAGCRSCRGERLSGSCGSLLCFLLICIVVVTVLFVCCSVKLPLSRPTGFLPVSFHSPPHAGGGRGCRVVLLLLAAAETKTLNWCPGVGWE